MGELSLPRQERRAWSQGSRHVVPCPAFPSRILVNERIHSTRRSHPLQKSCRPTVSILATRCFFGNALTVTEMRATMLFTISFFILIRRQRVKHYVDQFRCRM